MVYKDQLVLSCILIFNDFSDRNVTGKLDLERYWFNFCDDTLLKCNNKTTMFYMKDDKTNACVNMAGGKEMYSTFVYDYSKFKHFTINT